MPAGMWRHGIHTFLELLRARLPASQEYMMNFICLFYSMMSSLHETMPAFKGRWIECLGNLGRYRMAIEEEKPRDRKIWTNVSIHWYWYSKALDKGPNNRPVISPPRHPHSNEVKVSPSHPLVFPMESANTPCTSRSLLLCLFGTRDWILWISKSGID
jgi:hypothetical protein